MAAAIRLARFNVTQAGRAKAYFMGLPSPAAGMTLATYYPFSQTALFASALHGLPWHLLLTFLMIALTILMVSNVHYPTLPRAGFRTASGLLGLTLIVVILVFGIWKHDVFLFPLGIAYMVYGVTRAILLGFFKAPAEDEEAEIAGPIVIDESDQNYRGPRRPGAA
jgi:CDP-diacylglycerol--serine O-phosphatidyltransferase